MTIPTLEQFEQVLACINKGMEPAFLQAVKELEKAKEPSGITDPLAALPEKEVLLRLLTEEAERRISAIEKFPAMKWFCKQPGVLKARTSVHGRKILTGPPEQGIIIRSTDYLLKSFRDVTVEEIQALRNTNELWKKRLPTGEDVVNEVHWQNLVPTKKQRFLYRLRRVMPYAWEGGVLAALRNYFYTDYWKRHYDEVRSRESDLKAALKGLEALQRLGEFHIAPYRVAGFMDESHFWISELKKRISAELNATLQAPYPIQRNDVTAKERALVFELYRNNIETVARKKLKVICDLMYLEGIANPLGARTIERLVSNWYLSNRKWRSSIYDS